jgi:putative peptidoglycan lipid II flippase
VIRIALATAVGYVLALHAPERLGVARLWGAAGLTLAASLAAWVELLLLRRALNARIGATGLAAAYMMKLWTAAIAAAAAAWGVRLLAPPLHPALAAAVILIPYGAVFLGGTLLMRLPEASALLRRLRI